MLILTEHKLYQAHKCYNANNYWHLTTISMVKTMSESLKAKHVFSTFQFYEHFKFHAQVVHEKSGSHIFKHLYALCIQFIRRKNHIVSVVKMG